VIGSDFSDGTTIAAVGVDVVWAEIVRTAPNITAIIRGRLLILIDCVVPAINCLKLTLN
jgi:hypothetical protein